MSDPQRPPSGDGRPPGTPYLSRRERRDGGEPDPRARERAVRTSRLFAAALAGTVLFMLLAPPWPWPVFVLVLAVGSTVLGVVALIQHRAARDGGPAAALMAAGLALALFLTLSSAGQVMFWQEYRDYAECQQAAITQQARARCDLRLDRSLQERMERVQHDLLGD